MKKGLKITGIILAALLLIIIILPFALKGKIDGIIKSEAEKALKARVDFESLGISLIRHFPNASVDLKGLAVVGIDEFEQDTLVSAKRISLVVNIMSLFGDSGIEVSKLILDKPSAKALVLADGSVNWDIVRESDSPAQQAESVAAEEEPSSLKLQMKDLRINNGVVVFINDSTKMQAYARDINLRLSGDLSTGQSDLDIKLDAKGIYVVMDKITMLSNAETEASMKIKADLENNRYTFDKNSIRLNAIKLSLDGWVALLENDVIETDIKIDSEQINFKDILSMIPAFYANNFKDLTATGNLSFEGWIKGKMEGDKLPAFNLGIDVANGGIKYASLPKSIDNINVTASVSNPGGIADKSVIDVSRFSLSVAGNPFNATLKASTPVSDLNFNASVNGKVDLGMIKEVYPLGDSVNLNGLLTADIKMAGRMSDIEKERYENMRGEGVFTVENMLAQMPDMPAVSINSATASISPAAMALRNVSLQVGRSDVKASGEVTNYLPYIFKDEKLSGRFSVSSNLLDLNELMGDSGTETTAETSVADTASLPLTAFEVPKNLDLRLDASLKEVLLQKMVLSDISGMITVADGTVKMNNLGLKALGGTMQASGSYSTAENTINPSLALSLNAANASFSRTFEELEMIKRFVPLFEKTGGNYSLKMDMTAKLNNDMTPDLMSVEAKGVVSSADIHIQNLKAFDVLAEALKDDRIRNIQAKDISIPFTIENGLLATSPFDLKLGDIKMNVSGNTGLDQSINYTAKIALPSGVTKGLVSNVDAKIGGTFSNPKVSVDLLGAAQEALGNVISEQVSKLLGGSEGSSVNVSEEIEKQAEKLRNEANSAADKLVEAAKQQGSKLVEQANNPLTKIAAQKSADLLVSEAEKQAQKLRDEAEKKIEELKSNAQAKTGN